MPDAAPEADVVGNLDAALLERLWAIFDVALEVVQRPEEPCGEPSAEQWSRLHLALAAVPECQRDKPLLSAAEIERLRAEVAPVRCPCCDGYRDRGDGTHDHCGVCDDDGEVSPAQAAEFQIGIRDTELEALRAEVAELQEIRKVAGAALRCALSPDSDRIARDGFTESALAYLAGYGGDWNAMQAAEKGRARGH